MKRKQLIVLTVALFAVGVVMAQTNAPVTNAPPSNVITLPSLSSIPSWLQLLITPITLALVALVQKYLPKVSGVWLPIVAVFVGALVNVASDAIGFWGSQGLVGSAVAGAALGGLATWLHQLGKQSGILPTNPVTPPAPPAPPAA